MTFEPTGNMCALLLVGVARTFGTVGHVQQSDGKPYIERVPGSEWGFEHLTKRKNMVVFRDSHSLHY